MRLPLIPRERVFFDLFDQLCTHIVEGCGRLCSLLAGPGGAAAAPARAKIKESEHAADEVTHEVIRLLNRTFVTPFDREDVYSLVSGLDDVLDDVDEVADVVVVYRIDPIPPAAEDMAVLVRDAALQLQAAVGKLASLKGLDAHWVEVHRLENEGDTVSRAAIGELFTDGRDALEVLKLKDLYALLENALDKCEDVANVIESIAIKNA